MLFFKTGREVHGPEHRLIMIILLRDKTRLLSKRIVDNLLRLFFVVYKAAWKFKQH